ncbi:MAG: oligosaccharide flippase family protein [Candidatus Heimdallarchaeota archaeon]|nr:oligosaccharide flippase family protein [Candidatus Heimdallarchaeota archaeon]
MIVGNMKESEKFVPSDIELSEQMAITQEDAEKDSSLLSGSSLIFLANIIISLTGFVLAGILMHNMPDYVYGMARTLQRAVAISTTIVLNGLGNALAVHLSEKRGEPQQTSILIIATTILSIFVGMLFAIGFFFVIKYLFKTDISTFLTDIEVLLSLFLVFPAAFLVSAFNHALLGLKRVKENAIAVAIQSIGNLAFTTLFVYLGSQTFSVIFGLGVASLLSIFYSLFCLRKQLFAFIKRKKPFRNLWKSYKELRVLLSFSSPLTIAAICSQAIEGVTILIILIYFNWGHVALVQLAYFNYVLMLVIACRIPQISIGKMLLPHLKEYTLNDAKKQLHRAIRFLLFIIIPLNLFVGLFSKELLQLLAIIIRSKGFWLESGEITITALLQLLTIGGQSAAIYYLLVSSCVPLKHPEINAKIEFAGLVANVFLILYFLPSYGIRGVGFAYLISYTFMLIYAIISMALNQIIRAQSIFEILGTTIVVNAILLLNYFIKFALLWRILITAGTLALCFLVIIRINKKDVILTLNLIKHALGRKGKQEQL